MHSRSQRFELELRNDPAGDRGRSCCPGPRDPRELFDFSGGQELIDEAYDLAPRSSSTGSLPVDDARTARRRKRFRAVGRPHRVAASRPTAAQPREELGGVAWRTRARRSGAMPRNSTPTAAIVSAMPVPTSTRNCGSAWLRFVVSAFRCVHREHDAQVDERGDDGGEHADQRERVLPRVDGGVEHRQLGDEAAGERHTGLGEQEQRQQAGEHGLARRRGRGSRRACGRSSPRRATTVTTANAPNTISAYASR